MAKAASSAKKPKSAPVVDEGREFADPRQVAAELRLFAENPRMAGALEKMRGLAAGSAGGPEGLYGSIPQCLLIEGGTEEERLQAALYWAALLNCGKAEAPCLACPDCLRMAGRVHRDCFFFDGRAESIKIDSVRALRSVLGEPPREARYRAVIFCEAQALGDAAANSLLKSLEDPRPGTSFMLLAPQRERLLPTLVSRSWVLTLPWPLAAGLMSGPRMGEAVGWGQALLQMARNGQGWMERTGRKGSLDKRLALDIVNLCALSLLQAISDGARGPEGTPLALAFSRLTPERQRMADEILAEAQDSLECGVSPALAIDWLATRFYFILGPALKAEPRP